MNKQKTIKALEELAKSEYSAATALDAAFTEAEDRKLRRNLRRWRDSHIKQAETINERIKELGGQTTHYELGMGNGHHPFWSVVRGEQDGKSLTGIRHAAERGVKEYIHHLGEINDPKTLELVRKNLEAKQHEMQWYDDQVIAEHDTELETKLAKTRAIVKSLEKEVKEVKKEKHEGRRRSPLAAIIVALAIGVAAYFLMRRDDESDEDAFADDYNYESYEQVAGPDGTENNPE